MHPRQSGSAPVAFAWIGMRVAGSSCLTRKRGEDDEVRKFAQKMVTDHEKANMELKAIAQKQSLMVPREMDPKHKAKMDELKSQSGEDFESAYSMAMQKDHDKAVELFTEASRSQNLNSDLKAFAAKTLPTLTQHHQLAATLPATETRAASAEAEPKSEKR